MALAAVARWCSTSARIFSLFALVPRIKTIKHPTSKTPHHFERPGHSCLTSSPRLWSHSPSSASQSRHVAGYPRCCCECCDKYGQCPEQHPIKISPILSPGPEDTGYLVVQVQLQPSLAGLVCSQLLVHLIVKSD